MKTKFMFSKNIIYKKFNLKNSGKIKNKDFSKLINEDNQIFSTMKKSYKNKYNIKLIKKKFLTKTLGYLVLEVRYWAQKQFITFST